MTEQETIDAICRWLRSRDQTGVAHTHTIAKDLERGDWRDEDTHSETAAYLRPGAVYVSTAYHDKGKRFTVRHVDGVIFEAEDPKATVDACSRATFLANFAPPKVEIGDEWNEHGPVPRPSSAPCAREAEVVPARMILTCPSCGQQHVDEGEWATRVHRTHQCVAGPFGKGCGREWRPDPIATVGVRHADLKQPADKASVGTFSCPALPINEDDQRLVDRLMRENTPQGTKPLRRPDATPKDGES